MRIYCCVLLRLTQRRQLGGGMVRL
uniref:Uncharacterized protein n=1 Tax=Lepeophtheirus salmonis TaxID=72036 RepID=A0A0K2SWK5_LEPSM